MFEDLKAAALRHTPPLTELQSAGEQALGPAAVAAVAVLTLAVLSFGKKSASSAAAWALLAAVGVANYYRHALPWWPERRPDVPVIAWHWLFPLFVLFVHDGALLGSEGRTWRVWVRRLALVGFAAWVLVPPDFRKPSVPVPSFTDQWPVAAFAALVLLGWAGSEAVARQSPGWTVALGLSFALFGAGFVLAHAHSASLADVLSIAGAGMFGVAVVAFAARVDVSGAIPGATLLLPAVLMIGKNVTFSEVPWSAYITAAAPPVAVGLLAIPPVSRLTTWRWPLFWVLCLGPTAAAVTLAMRAETLIEEW
ncbi:MAG TPA: hypothetical protein VM597_03125 [Gemmataceae bacterium]|jgi:hypothetical protein|nr:hypothetical protein [Gemmataceae bacterium]